MVLAKTNKTIQNILCNTASSLVGTNEYDRIIILCDQTGLWVQKHERE
jgi:hypothetical protein